MQQHIKQTDLLSDLKTKLVKCRTMTPAAKGLAGMILFKLENNISLDNTEQKFFDELYVFLQIST